MLFDCSRDPGLACSRFVLKWSRNIPECLRESNCGGSVENDSASPFSSAVATGEMFSPWRCPRQPLNLDYEFTLHAPPPNAYY